MSHLHRFIPLASLLFMAACANGPEVYNFQASPAVEADAALVKVQRGFSGPVVLLARVDGVDPLRHKAMAGHRPKGLERYEPRLISVSPGEHTYVAQFQLTDLLGQAVRDEIIAESAKKYPIPDHEVVRGTPDFGTLLHSEHLTFNALRGGRYLLRYQWDKAAKEISILVEQCNKEWVGCAPYPFTTSGAETRFILGMGRQAE